MLAQGRADASPGFGPRTAGVELATGETVDSMKNQSHRAQACLSSARVMEAAAVIPLIAAPVRLVGLGPIVQR